MQNHIQSNSDYTAAKVEDNRSPIDRVFDKNGDYKRGVELFEAQFDNQLTTMNSTSDSLKMDNATFIKICSEY